LSPVTRPSSPLTCHSSLVTFLSNYNLHITPICNIAAGRSPV
jgi:hypothetical protein